MADWLSWFKGGFRIWMKGGVSSQRVVKTFFYLTSLVKSTRRGSSERFELEYFKLFTRLVGSRGSVLD